MLSKEPWQPVLPVWPWGPSCPGRPLPVTPTDPLGPFEPITTKTLRLQNNIWELRHTSLPRSIHPSVFGITYTLSHFAFRHFYPKTRFVNVFSCIWFYCYYSTIVFYYSNYSVELSILCSRYAAFTRRRAWRQECHHQGVSRLCRTSFPLPSFLTPQSPVSLGAPGSLGSSLPWLALGDGESRRASKVGKYKHKEMGFSVWIQIYVCETYLKRFSKLI